MSPVIVLGADVQGGAYVLRLRIGADLTLAFGRFRDGAPVHILAGEAVYAGSARGEHGASSLARRLLRHAARSGDQPPHDLRAVMRSRFAQVGLGQGNLPDGSLLPAGKTLFWHADYLLDHPEVTLTHVIAIRTRMRLEPALADLLLADAHTAIIAPGLGASDSSGKTHLLRYDGGDDGWAPLVRRIEALLTIGP